MVQRGWEVGAMVVGLVVGMLTVGAAVAKKGRVISQYGS